MENRYQQRRPQPTSIEINLKHNLPLTRGFTSYVYIKETLKSKERIKIGHIAEKSGVNCVVKIKKEFISLVQNLRFSLDTHVVNKQRKIVGLSFYK